ncbi:MAG: dihydroorotase [Eubacterium sp.]|nr:dihydroorotase [Eubacterium sp.]
MATLLANGRVFMGLKFVSADILLEGESAFVIDRGAAPGNTHIDEVIDLSGKDILPGFADVHVHFREPGFSYKETIRTGSEAAAHGGYTCVCPMPNIVPVPKDYESLKTELDIIDRDACIDVIPYGAITVMQDGRSELSDMESMAPYVCAFSDDGRGVQTGGLMRDAMQLAKSVGKLIVAHCEDENLLEPGGCIHAGSFADASGLTGISSASEWKQVERDVDLCYETGCGYHVCHVSTRESVEIIREAKKSGVNVTCETAPHYLVLTQDDLAEYCRGGEPADSGRFKMNPPLRNRADRDALREAVFDGTIDMIATDHAPHSAEEKSRGLEKSPFGIVGLETAFPVLKTRLVDTGLLTYERLIECITSAPRKRFGLPGAEILEGGSFRPVFSETAGGGCEGNVGYKDAEAGKRMIFSDMTVIDPEAEYVIDPGDFRTMGRATPFEGDLVRGRVIMTIHKGKTADIQ